MEVNKIQLSPRNIAAPRIFKDDSFFISSDPFQHEAAIPLLSFKIESQIGIKQFKQKNDAKVYMFTIRIGEVALKSWFSNQEGGE